MNAPQSIGQTLLAAGLIGEDQLRIALREQPARRQPLGRVLVDMGFVSEAALRETLATRSGLPFVDLSVALADPDAVARVPQALARRHRLLPLQYDAARHRLIVAMADAHDIVALDRLRGELGPDVHIELRLAGDTELGRAIDHHYGEAGSIEDLVRALESRTPSEVRDGQLVVRLVDALLADAAARGASDLHFEPEPAFLRIRHRIDGTLRQVRAIHKACWPELAVRLKVMAGLDIAESRSPQDGRISVAVGGRAIDFRVATQPTLHGENIVLRILDRDKGIVPLPALGLDEDQAATLARILGRPDGLTLVVGPTGSGKTTTLYSILNHLNTEAVNIMTLEDPVEYPLAMIRQTQIGDAARLGFADGVRALLRQDPDVILVGEIRDADTAAMALRAALTGHQVFATLHANSVFGALPRLLDIGLNAELLAGNLAGILSQRLVRCLCPHCRTAHVADGAERALLGLATDTATPVLYHAAGCPACDFRGYRGRRAIFEILHLTPELDELIARKASPGMLQAAAREAGHRSLLEDGLRRVADGTTSLHELARVVDLGQAGKAAARGACA
ncbi:GspE/PulE family protein [Thauera mechernichensis]|uniref:GspE/PulE family protein n=1 Tax=Thauera mechernichensis TaxID=82788 RepID=A0ABW3WCD4_9RHOO|nr:GspE/PulE family protein [Thauera mechernichensis]MDG3065600.1 GspE/PulE family protein [Thauera mechernichensis]